MQSMRAFILNHGLDKIDEQTSFQESQALNAGKKFWYDAIYR